MNSYDLSIGCLRFIQKNCMDTVKHVQALGINNSKSRKVIRESLAEACFVGWLIKRPDVKAMITVDVANALLERICEWMEIKSGCYAIVTPTNGIINRLYKQTLLSI